MFRRYGGYSTKWDKSIAKHLKKWFFQSLPVILRASNYLYRREGCWKLNKNVCSNSFNFSLKNTLYIHYTVKFLCMLRTAYYLKIERFYSQSCWIVSLNMLCSIRLQPDICILPYYLLFFYFSSNHIRLLYMFIYFIIIHVIRILLLYFVLNSTAYVLLPTGSISLFYDNYMYVNIYNIQNIILKNSQWLNCTCKLDEITGNICTLSKAFSIHPVKYFNTLDKKNTPFWSINSAIKCSNFLHLFLKI